MARKQRHEQTHHGGAWKVAYADFVTAMMSLFIVLWVLGSSVENQVAVAAYFRHPSIFKKGGSGFLNKEGMLEYQRAVDSISARDAAVAHRAKCLMFMAFSMQGGSGCEPGALVAGCKCGRARTHADSAERASACQTMRRRTRRPADRFRAHRRGARPRRQ